jgi:flavin reductase (DIM6/NTAB) family NADH-FMN oxidoreductase RutF
MSNCIQFEEIMELELRKRAHLINSVGGFKSLGLIGTKDQKEQTNLAIFSSIVHIGANPPLISFIMRPDSVERHTLSNILETGYYTINHVNENIFQQSHQTSARYAKEQSEFDCTGLTSEYKNGFFAPFVKESAVQLGMIFKEKVNLSINHTIMIIGQIDQIHFPLDCLHEDGYLDIEKAGTISCSGLDSYHRTVRIARLPYAKPDK